ncbi:MAG: inorganic pyrophosphatase [Ruminococcaceae bacterium]|nr:inorganic pyrophosphatase [Oscillospiraceae bacterium]
MGLSVSGRVDRPLGSRHPRFPDTVYPVNYGYVEGIAAPDGAEQDAYVLGTDAPIAEFSGVVIAVYARSDDVEDKWIVSLDGRDYNDEEILEKIRFQEQYYHGRLFRG